MKIRKVSVKRNATLIIFAAFILIQSITLASTAIGVRQETENIIAEESYLTADEQEALNLINDYRRANGLSDLKTSMLLRNIARMKAEDMINNQYFSHTSDNLGTPFDMLKDNGVTYKIAGENLAGNTTPEGAVKDWINSRPHRKNILEEDFEYTGIYIIESPVFGKVFVQIFVGM